MPLGSAFVAVLGAVVVAIPLGAQQWGTDARYYLNWGAPGSRAGDIQGYGISVRRLFHGSLGRAWEALLSIDRFEYDLETPIHATRINPRPGDLPVDAFTTVLRGELGVVRRFRSAARWSPFLTGAVGVYSIDVPDVSGTTDTGGRFELRTESPTTGGVTLGLGSEWRLAGRTAASLGLSYSQTFRKYAVTETSSGATGTIRPFAPLGLKAQVIQRW